MSGTSQALRLSEYLVSRACRYLPSEIRDERYREWTAELPYILHDPDVRFTYLRILRMLAFASDHCRSALASRGRQIPADLSRLGATAVEGVFGVVVAVARVVRGIAFVVVAPAAAASIAISRGASDVIAALAALAAVALEILPFVFLVWVSLAIRREERMGSLRHASPGASARMVRRLTGVHTR